MKEDLTTLSLSQINKRSQSLQKRIREISNDPNIKGTVTEGPKADMIDAVYKSENAALTKARHAINRKNSIKKYGDKFPVLDPDNDAFIIMYLDEVGSPVKVGRWKMKSSADKHPITGELTKKEGTSFWDVWDPKKNQMRKEGEEVWHETINDSGKTIMSNPDYKIPKTENMEIWNELYSDLSTSDLAKKGFKLKNIDMLMKGREVKKYLTAQETAEKGLDTGIKMHERTSSSSIGKIMEDLYFRGDDIYKMSVKEWITKIPEHFAEGGRTGFHQGSLRHQKEHDYRSYEKEGNLMKYLALSGDQSKVHSPESGAFGSFLFRPDPDERMDYEQAMDDFETWQKERFMYGEHKPPSNFEQIWSDIQKLLDKKRNEHATGGISNLFQERQGYRSGKAVELITKLPEFLKFVERLLIKASNEIRQGIGKWKGLDIKQKTVQHDNLTKMVTEFQKTKKFDPKMNEYFGIDAEKAFVEAQAKVTPVNERTMLKQKYPQLTDDLLEKILVDDNPQRKADVLATMDEYLKLLEIGKSEGEAFDIITRSFSKTPTKHATGGLIPGYATGGVSNLFRSR